MHLTIVPERRTFSCNVCLADGHSPLSGRLSRQTARAGAERMPSVERRRVVRKLGTPAEKSNAQADAVTNRQRTDETVQRAVQHGLLGPYLSTENLIQILAQPAHSIKGATAKRRVLTYPAFPCISAIRCLPTTVRLAAVLACVCPTSDAPIEQIAAGATRIRLSLPTRSLRLFRALCLHRP